MNAQRASCDQCDGTGCPCWRSRDWQSIELGCHEGCPECGRNSCKPRPQKLQNAMAGGGQ